MLRLVQSEFMKLFYRASTYIMIGVIVLLVLGSGIIGKLTENPDRHGDNWKESLTTTNTELIKQNKELENNTLITNFNKNTIALNEYRLENDMKPSSTLNVWSYTEQNFPLITIAGLIIIIVAASIVSSEFSWGTIKLVMIRPVSRFKVLLSKYVTVLLFGVIVITTLFISSLLVGLIFFGNSETNIHLTVHNGVVFEENILWYLIRYFLISTVDLWMMTSMAFMLSTLFRSNAMALGISLFAYLMGSTFTNLLAGKFEGMKYVLFANTDLNMYSSGTVLIKGMTLGFSITVLLVYLTVFLTTSFVSFQKRDIAS